MARTLDELAPDPRDYRSAIPSRLFRAWQIGELGVGEEARHELWTRTARLLGERELRRRLGLPVPADEHYASAA